MKKTLIKCMLLLAVMAVGSETVSAQAKRTVKKRPTTTKKTTTSKNTGNAAATVAAPAKDTTPVAPKELELTVVRKSLRNDNAVERNLVKERTPLNYEHIREDDAVYRQRLWREIDVHEKMNLPFIYRADDDNGNQRFINILLNTIKSGEASAFNPTDDRFTTPMTMAEITKQLVGEPVTVQVPNWTLDPDGSKGIMKDSIIQNEFNPDD